MPGPAKEKHLMREVIITLAVLLVLGGFLAYVWSRNRAGRARGVRPSVQNIDRGAPGDGDDEVGVNVLPEVRRNSEAWTTRKSDEIAEEAFVQTRAPDLKPAIQEVKTDDVYIPLRVVVEMKPPPAEGWISEDKKEEQEKKPALTD